MLYDDPSLLGLNARGIAFVLLNKVIRLTICHFLFWWFTKNFLTFVM